MRKFNGDTMREQTGTREIPDRSTLANVSGAIIVCFILFGTWGTQAFAQGSAGRWELFAEGGGSFWNSQSSQEVNNDFGLCPSGNCLYARTNKLKSTGRFFGGVRFWMNAREAFEASYAYAPGDLTVAVQCGTAFCDGALPTCPFGSSPYCLVTSYPSTTNANFFSLNYVRRFRPDARIRPFVTAGPGLVHFFRVASNAIYEPHPFTFNFGVGIDVGLTQHWSFRAEDREWLLESPRECSHVNCRLSPASGPSGLGLNQAPTVGLVYRF